MKLFYTFSFVVIEKTIYNFLLNFGKFIQVVSSAIIDKYIGESARLIREMFGYARDHQVRLYEGNLF